MAPPPAAPSAAPAGMAVAGDGRHYRRCHRHCSVQAKFELPVELLLGVLRARVAAWRSNSSGSLAVPCNSTPLAPLQPATSGDNQDVGSLCSWDDLSAGLEEVLILEKQGSLRQIFLRNSPCRHPQVAPVNDR